MEKQPLSIGSRVEMFVDDYLIDSMYGTTHQLHNPVPREKALVLDRPWEGPGSGVYACAFRAEDRYRLYYRATSFENKDDLYELQYNCLAESDDGIHWERPALGLIDIDGSRENNALFSGSLAHNFSPFLDSNPNCPPEARYKAVCGHYPEGLMAFQSPDGIHWEPMQAEPVIRQGAFDSHNLCFYDNLAGVYRCYSRYFGNPVTRDNHHDHGKTNLGIHIRCIQSCTSKDFLHWTDPVPNTYDADAPAEQFYTNATIPCPGAEHILISTPMRFAQERYKVPSHGFVGVSDAVFMTSRDGVHFDRTFPEGWIRPALDERCWTQRNYISAWGILETSPTEFSFYTCEHYEWDDCYIRRYTVRRHGFASVRAGYRGGFFLTKPFVFDGSALHLNYATSAVGSVRVGITNDGTGWPGMGYSVEDCDVIYGNELDHVVTWRGKSDLSHMAGKTVQLRIELKDADLFAIQFR